MLHYKPNAAEAIARLSRLFERRAPGEIFATIGVPSAALADFRRQYPEGFCAYPDPLQRIAFWDRLLAERAALEDDSIPSAYLSEMDQGLYGGVLGGAAQFMSHPDTGWISSMVAPLLADLAELDRLKFDRSGEWFRRYHRQLEVFAAGAAGKFGVSHFILIDGLNFVFELIGATATYLALDECPEQVRRAIDFAYELNVAIQEAFFECAGLLAGGTASNMVGWLPGRIVSESVDPFHMTSVAYFEQWGREPAERILGRFDGGVVHIHGNGRHLLEAVATLRGLRAMFLGDDRGYPAAFDVLPDLQARTGDLPLVVQADYAPFVERLRRHALPGGVLYHVRGAASIADANSLMDEVRAYRL